MRDGLDFMIFLGTLTRLGCQRQRSKKLQAPPGEIGVSTIGVQFKIAGPVLDCLTLSTEFFAGCFQIEVRVRESRVHFDGLFVEFNRLIGAAEFIQHVSQIEIGLGVVRVSSDSLTIIALSLFKLLPIVIQRAYVDVGINIIGIDLDR